MIFTLTDCDFGIKRNGIDYEFVHVDSVTVTDPERNALTRGANAKNKVGLRYKTGTKEPKTWVIPILDVELSLKTVLDEIYEKGERVEVYAIDRLTGSSKMAKSAVLCNKPQQLSIDESAESMQVSLEFESFDLGEKVKEAP